MNCSENNSQLDAWRVLALHINATLPTDLTQRRAVLMALEWALPPKHRALPNVKAQLAALTATEQLNLELPGLFASGISTTTATNRNKNRE